MCTSIQSAVSREVHSGGLVSCSSNYFKNI
uniref:Uncharacterized protein n=1 Tax=Anguilla anguilla TaxID=7936 RepID=A0A0E9RZQ3_ANGAN